MVLSLCKTNENPYDSVIFCDNWFSCSKLIIYLAEKFGVFSLGTKQPNGNRKEEEVLTPTDLILKRCYNCEMDCVMEPIHQV